MYFVGKDFAGRLQLPSTTYKTQRNSPLLHCLSKHGHVGFVLAWSSFRAEKRVSCCCRTHTWMRTGMVGLKM